MMGSKSLLLIVILFFLNQNSLNFTLTVSFKLTERISCVTRRENPRSFNISEESFIMRKLKISGKNDFKMRVEKKRGEGVKHDIIEK